MVADLTLETSVTGSVSLEAEKKGINMSRIMRTFYKHAEETFSFEVIERALDAYKSDLESFDARIQMRFSFPMRVNSLRSGLSGYQYYDIALELIEVDGARREMCIWIMCIQAHARVRLNYPSMPASFVASLRRRTVNGLWRACRWSLKPISQFCGLRM